jgi:hypothetical protein
MTSSASAPVSRTRPPARRRPRKRLTALAPVVVAALLLAVSCSDDDDSTAPEPDESTTSPRPTTTEPEADASTADELRQEIQELLRSYDEVLAEIVADPAIASDRENPLYTELRGLIAPDSEAMEPVINAVVAAGGRGDRQVPHGQSELPVERRVEGNVQTVSDDEFRVLACAHLSYEVFDRQDEQISVVDGPVQPSQLTVVRVDGEFRIRQFEPTEENTCVEAQ